MSDVRPTVEVVLDMASQKDYTLKTEVVPCKETKDCHKTVLYAIISRMRNDHAIFYFFIDGPDQHVRLRIVLDMITSSDQNLMGNDLVIVEMNESFVTNEDVDKRAIELKKGLPNANVFTPAITGGY